MMSIPAHVRFGLSTVIGIVLVTAAGYWFASDFNTRHMRDLIAGTGPENPGLIASAPSDLRESRHELSINALLFAADELDSRRSIRLEVRLALADLLRPGEAAPPDYMTRLYIEARAPALLAERCAEWQAAMAARCRFLNAAIDRNLDGGGALSADSPVEVVALYAITPKMMDPAPAGDPARMERELQKIRFELEGRHTTDATRPGLIAAAYQTALRACAQMRDQSGNCAFLRFEFSESRRNSEGVFNFSGGATLGSLKTDAGKS